LKTIIIFYSGKSGAPSCRFVFEIRVLQFNVIVVLDTAMF